MATSGSKSVTVTSYNTLKFSWWFNDGDQSIADNTTLIRWKLELIAGSSGRIGSTASKSWSVTVDSKNYSGTNTVGIDNNETKTLASGTKLVTHTTDGSKSFNYSFSQEFSITFSGSQIGTKSGSGSGTLTTIPRKSSLTVNNGTLNASQNIKVTRQASSFWHSVKAVCGSSTVYIKADGSTQTSEIRHQDTDFNFTPPASWASQNTTGNSVSVNYTITTYTAQSGGTKIGTNSYSKTCSIPNSSPFKPSCSISVTDSMGYLATYGAYIKGKSKFKVTVTPTLAYSSPIDLYSVTANGTNYNSASFTTGVPKTVGNNTITATVKDSRGNTSASVSKSVSVIDYNPPRILLLKVNRCNEDLTDNDKGGCAKITFSASVTSLDNRNNVSYSLMYRKQSETNYTAIDTSGITTYEVTEATFSFPADTGSSYDVLLTVTDNFGSIDKATTVSTDAVLMHWRADGNGMGIGKVGEIAEGLDVGYKTVFRKNVSQQHGDEGEESWFNAKRTDTGNEINFGVGSGGVNRGVWTKNMQTTAGENTDGWIEYVNSAGYVNSQRAQRTLWSGSWHMTSGHTANLSEPVSKQLNGIVLVFCVYYSSSDTNYGYQSFFVPKQLVALAPDKVHSFFLNRVTFGAVAGKQLRISDTQIKGDDYNGDTGTANGITFANNKFVLRYVIGV